MLDSAPWLHRASWPSDPAHVADARHFVDDRLREHGLWRHSEAVMVVVSELATNAILYTRVPFSVSLQQDDDTLTVSVRDGSRAPLERIHRQEDLGVRGRGLQIVERLSSAWGVTAHHNGKSVWACFDLPSTRGSATQPPDAWDDAGMQDIAPSRGGVRIERIVTSGSIESAHGSLELDNNTWVLGTDTECLLVDAGHDGRLIVKSIALQRRVHGVLITHGHQDHINAVGEVCDGTRAPAYLHPEDRMLWDALYPVTPDRELADGDVLTIGDVDLHVIHTPGHTPGSCCFYAPALDALFTGDTLFPGGPGATGRPHSDFGTIIESIRTRLFALPEETVVLPGHGEATVIGAESPHLQEWIDRGW